MMKILETKWFVTLFYLFIIILLLFYCYFDSDKLNKYK